MASKSVIISAGGMGTRMESDLPKQFLCIKDKPIILHTIEKFLAYDKTIELVVVLPDAYVHVWEELCQKYFFTWPHKVVTGGPERFFSIQNGLTEVTGELVAVHDAVRPLVDVSVIDACFKAADKYGAAVPVIAVNESLRKMENGHSVAVNRADYKLVQTPQCFRTEIVVKAYRQPYSTNFTDDATVVEADGVKIQLVDGNRENLKITTPHDLKLADLFLN